MSRLTSQIRTVESLDLDLRARMFALYHRYYDGTGRELFMSDLSRKHLAIVLNDEDGHMQGFSLAAIWEMRLDSGPVRIVYSGDTIVDDRHWGEMTLPFAWVRMTGAIRALAPATPLYWWYLVMGHRTYRYLPALYRSYFPHHSRRTPSEAQMVMDALGQAAFGPRYDAATGVVRLAEAPAHLRHPWEVIPPRLRRRPEIRFFLDRNPGYARGDELACLAELSEQNHKPLPARLFRAGLGDAALLPPGDWRPVRIEALRAVSCDDAAADSLSPLLPSRS